MTRAAAIGIILCSAAIAAQSPSSTVPTGEVHADLQRGRFGIVTSIRGLPLGVRAGLQSLFGGQTLDIAEPGGAFQSAEMGDLSILPLRRLAAAGCSYDHCLVYYERGGDTHSWHVAIFHWTPDETNFEWGGTAPAGLRTIEDVRRAILSGAIGEPAAAW